MEDKLRRYEKIEFLGEGQVNIHREMVEVRLIYFFFSLPLYIKPEILRLV